MRNSLLGSSAFFPSDINIQDKIEPKKRKIEESKKSLRLRKVPVVMDEPKVSNNNELCTQFIFILIP